MDIHRRPTDKGDPVTATAPETTAATTQSTATRTIPATTTEVSPTLNQAPASVTGLLSGLLITDIL